MMNCVWKHKKVHDKETDMYLWQIEKAPLPENKRVPLNSIIIFSNPRHIYIPEGVSMSNDNPQLVLPNVFVKKTFNHAAGALFVANIKQFLSAPDITHEKKGSIVQAMVTG